MILREIRDFAESQRESKIRGKLFSRSSVIENINFSCFTLFIVTYASVLAIHIRPIYNVYSIRYKFDIDRSTN